MESTILEYITLKWEQYLKKRNEYYLQPDLDILTAKLKVETTTSDENLKETFHETLKEIELKRLPIFMNYLILTPTAKLNIDLCQNENEFYDYLWGNNKFIWHTLINDCLYPNDVNPSQEELNVYMKNRNIYIKNSLKWDKWIQLQAYSNLQQTIINRSIIDLISETKRISDESNDTTLQSQLQAEKANEIANKAIIISIIFGLVSIALGILQYFDDEVELKENQIILLQNIQEEIREIKNNQTSWDYILQSIKEIKKIEENWRNYLYNKNSK